ncbi:MAG: GIY-YIG nuclease family protein, partial [Bacteroidia bacterium]|nr:GIY-YIG nuclease family protein [Bacteroidia bacterium]
YLISHNKTNYYVGEGKELSKRLKQQFKPTTSTFYKNLLKLQKTNKAIGNISIDAFKVQVIVTDIGRKEIEEFGISNLPTLLNRFQLDKRKLHNVAHQDGLWDNVQKAKTDILLQAEQEILQGKFSSWFDCNAESVAGLYIVRDKHDKLIYIGESSDICERHKTHSSRTYFSALRRHIGTELLNFELQERNGKKKYFEVSEDKKITEFLKSCKATFYPTHFGRYELEEFLIKKHSPLLNRKDNKDE